MKPNLKNNLFVVLGCISLLLGTIGIGLPGLPTTPFLLLASWLFYHGNPKLQKWLQSSWLGVYIERYKKNGGMTPAQKAGAVGTMAVMVTISTVYMIPETSIARIIVPIAGFIGSFTVIIFVPNAKRNNNEDR